MPKIKPISHRINGIMVVEKRAVYILLNFVDKLFRINRIRFLLYERHIEQKLQFKLQIHANLYQITPKACQQVVHGQRRKH